MFRHDQRIRSMVTLWTLTILVLAHGGGCLPESPDPTGSSLESSPTPINVYITSDYMYATGETAYAAAVADGATGTLTYEWSITPPGLIIEGANDQLVSFTSSASGNAILTVTATDSGTGTSATDATQITFQGQEPTEPLTADPGPDQTVAVGDTVLLFGSASGGFGNYAFSWRQASGPAQATAPDYAFDDPAITVIGTTPGIAVFELIVHDYDYNFGVTIWATGTVRVEVVPASD